MTTIWPVGPRTKTIRSARIRRMCVSVRPEAPSVATFLLEFQDQERQSRYRRSGRVSST